MYAKEKKQFADDFKKQWKTMWRNHIDDKVRAEGIADKDYTLLFVERGTVIIATRKFKPLDFYEILRKHKSLNADEMISPNPSVGGWGKFARTVLSPKKAKIRRRQIPKKTKDNGCQQLKKSGRGWLHSRR